MRFSNYYNDFYFRLIQFQYQYNMQILRNTDRIIYKDIGFPQELILGAGFYPAVIESLIGMLPPNIVREEVLDRANIHFHESGCCSFHKLTLPALSQKLLPLSRAFIGLDVCQEVANHFSVLASKFQIPYSLITVSNEASEQSVDYLARQYHEVFRWLCSISGSNDNYSALLDIINNSNKATEFIQKGNEIRFKNPGIIYGGQMLKFINAQTLYGTEGAVVIAQEYFENCKKRSEDKEYVKSKYRLIWSNMGIAYDDELYEHIEKELGAVIVFEEFNSVQSEPLSLEDPFTSLAKRTFKTPFIGDIKQRVSNLINIANKCNADGVVFFSHLNCRLFNARFSLVKQALLKEGIPVLEIAGDCIDQRNYSRAQLLTRIEAFLEMLS